MLGISSTELLIIVVFGFLLFGPDKLPQMGRTLGRALRQFRETQEKMTSVVQSEVIDPMTAAASAPVKPKKAVAPAEDDSDADIDAGAAPRRKETFAERRARLAAEKAAKEQAESAQDAAGDQASDTAESDASVEAANAGSPTVESATTAPVAEEAVVAEPEIRTTDDLYARRSRKRKPAAESDMSEASESGEGGEQ